ncbi:PAS domain-containing protein [Methanogenium organophilum]|uniref:PAS domain-containing protein n=1 Tax=Methanogenium organophilum TaxID=2199 RepID=A0A9X9S383_METOG|nr:PAS domain-containing protein [Methanogenium organophilum]WAI00963.1 PAS domain-containing protein [Methanogenium organophilum]
MPGEQEMLDRIQNVLKFKSRGMTITEISHVTSTHRNSIAKYLQILLALGKVDLRVIGNAKVYTLSHRIPVSSLLNCSPDLIVLLNQERKIVQANDSYLKFFHYNANDVLNQEIYEKTFPIISDKSLIPFIDNSFEKGDIDSIKMNLTHDNKKYDFFIKYIPSALEGGDYGLIIIIKDITEEKRIQDELIKNETKFQNLLHNANDSIFLYEITDALRIGSLIDVNDTACKQLCYTRDELFRTEFDDIFNAKFHDETGAIRNDLRENCHAIYEGMQVRKNGTTFPAEASAHVFFLQDKRVVLYIMRDISERKIAEKSLKLSENRYQDIVEGQEELIFRISPDQSIQYGNEAFRRYFNLQNKTPGKNTLESLNILPDDRKLIQTSMSLADTENESIKIEFRIQQQDRKPTWIESRISPLYDTDRTIHEFQFIGKDITETKRAKEAMRRNEENTRFLLNSINDNSFLIDLNGRILSINQSSCEYIQKFCSDKSLNGTSIAGRSIYEFFPKDTGQTISSIASEIIFSKEPDIFVDEIQSRTFDFSLSPMINSDGEVEKIIVVKRDISDEISGFNHSQTSTTIQNNIA